MDIIAQDGQQWIKVSTVTETRLLFELAKAEWEGADSDSDSDENGLLVDGLAHTSINNGTLAKSQDSICQNRNDDERVEIIRQVQDLRKAALAHKVHYKHPSVSVILPKISKEPPPEISCILDTIRSLGATVHIGPLAPTDSQFAFSNIAPNPFANLTSILNIDCTILLALVSDLSHKATTPEPWFNKAISRQIELEKQEQLLPSTLWPVMAGKDLVCTKEAARRMQEIVDTIGTESERRRTDLLVLLPGQTPEKPEALRRGFAELSNYTIPSDWILPIRVVDSDIHDISHLPPAAQKVKESLTSINQSVFFYGWTRGLSTLTSNRTVAKQIEGIVEGEEGEQIGPKVWLCATARSLVGKEKGRRDLSRMVDEGF